MRSLIEKVGFLCVSIALVQMGTTLLITWLALHFDARGATQSLSGLLMACNALGMAVGALLGKRLIEHIGHIRSSALSVVTVTLLVWGHLISEALAVWLLLRFIVGAAAMVQIVVLESWLNARADEAGRGRAIGFYMLAFYVGIIFGQLSFSLETWLGAYLLLIVVLAYALSQLPLLLAAPPRREAQADNAQATSFNQLLAHAPQALGTALCCGLLNGSFYGLGGLYARQQGLDNEQIGVFMAVPFFCGLLAQAPLAWLSDRVPRQRLLRWILLCLCLPCLLLAVQQNPPLTLLLILAGAVGAFQFCLYPLAIALANQQLESQRRVAMSAVLLLTFASGLCIGPLLVGVLMQQLGAASLYYFFFLCALVLVLFVTLKQRKAPIACHP